MISSPHPSIPKVQQASLYMIIWLTHGQIYTVVNCFDFFYSKTRNFAFCLSDLKELWLYLLKEFWKGDIPVQPQSMGGGIDKENIDRQYLAFTLWAFYPHFWVQRTKPLLPFFWAKLQIKECRICNLRFSGR